MASRNRPLIKLLDAIPDDGERRLMLAVLMDALRIVQGHEPSVRGGRRRGRRAWQRERGWFIEDDPATPFSFVSICDALGLNASYVRRRALAHAGTGGQRRTLHGWSRK